MTQEPELTARLHGTGGPVVAFESDADRDGRPLGTVVDDGSGGPIGRVADLIRHRPVVLVAAVAAGFLLGRLLKRALRARH